MPPKAVVVRFVAKDEEAREQLLELLKGAADNAASKEPGLRRYAITTESQNGLSQAHDERAVWVIEEYVDDSAYDNHLSQAPIQHLREWLSGSGGEAPRIWTLDVQADSNFTKPEVVGYKNPVIVFTELGYKPGTAQSTLPYWKEVAKVSEVESGTFVWGVSRDHEDSDKLAIMHVYESTEYLIKIHATSKEMQAVQEFTANSRTHLTVYFLKLVGGYLWK